MSKMQDEVIGNHQRRKDDEKNPRPMVKNASDLQRLKLEKLMKNPEKPVIIPEHPREKDYDNAVPSFVRNVMGSSAGAGSGEFHVYRHLRRKEYARQKQIQAKSVREQLDDNFREKIELHRLESESKTAKKRAKRQKKKEKMKQKGKRPKIANNDNHDATNTNSEDSDEDRSSGNDIEDSSSKSKDESANADPEVIVEECSKAQSDEDRSSENDIEHSSSKSKEDTANAEPEVIVEDCSKAQSDEVINLKTTEDKSTESEIVEDAKQTDEADTQIEDK